MTDSEIQYIGNWSSDKITSNFSALNVSAFILTTEDDSKFRSTFSRSQSPVVLIGRSPLSNEPKEHEARATYSNPLMSRSHAKIAFSGSDMVSLTDTHSHHGTWVNRKSEDIKLTPDKPFRLEDGDKITFGKGVFKDGVMHMPLVVSVKLLFNPSTPPSVRPSSCSVTPQDDPRSSRSGRNRFGLSLSSSSESELSSDSEEVVIHHDDVETGGLGTSSSLYGLTSPQSSPDPLPIISHPAICEPLPPIDPGVQDEDEDRNLVRADPNVIVLDSQTSTTIPPWRRFSHSPWFDVTSVTSSLLRHVPDILPRPFSRTESLFGSRHSKSDVNSQESNATHSHPHVHVHAHNQSHAHGPSLPPPVHSHHSHHAHHAHHAHHHHHHHAFSHDPIPDHSAFHQSHIDHHHQSHDHQNAEDTNTPEGQVKVLGDAIKLLQEELQTLKTTVSRLDHSHITNEQVQSLIENLENRVPDLSLKLTEEYMSSFKSSLENPLKSLEQTIADLQRTMPGFQSYIAASEKKFDAVQNDIEKVQGLHKRVDSMHSFYLDARDKWDADHVAIKGCKHDIDLIRKDLEDLCQIWDKRNRDRDESINTHEDGLESRLKEYINAELTRLINAEPSPVLGKRKRPTEEDHEYVDAHVQTIEDPAVTTLIVAGPPTKRLKTLRSYIVPGVIGAVGAWIGLAYL